MKIIRIIIRLSRIQFRLIRQLGKLFWQEYCLLIDINNEVINSLAKSTFRKILKAYNVRNWSTDRHREQNYQHMMSVNNFISIKLPGDSIHS